MTVTILQNLCLQFKLINKGNLSFKLFNAAIGSAKDPLAVFIRACTKAKRPLLAVAKKMVCLLRWQLK